MLVWARVIVDCLWPLLSSYAVIEKFDSPMVKQEPLSLINILNPDMEGESDLQKNTYSEWAMGEILGIHHTQEKSITQMLSIMLVMLKQQQKNVMITL